MRILLLIAFIVSTNTTINAQWSRTNGPYGGSISELAIKGTTIIAGTNGDGVFLSDNNGASWTQTTFTGASITALVVDTSNIYAGTYGYAGVYISSDNGITWSQANTGLTNTHVWCLAKNDSDLYAGTNGGGYSIQLTMEVPG